MFVRTRFGILAAMVFLLLVSLSALGYAQTAPLQHMQMYIIDIADEGRSTITVNGVVSDEVALPVTVSFSLPAGFELKMLKGFDTATGEQLDDASYTVAESEASSKYHVTLTAGRGFTAGFDVAGSVYDRGTQMGDSALASMMFVPPNDLESLVVGFVAPSEDYVGAGTDVQLLGESDDGEIYGIIRENVTGGEIQDFVVAFAKRENRDAAFAEIMEAEATAAELARQQTFGYWITSPRGVLSAGVGLALLIAIVLLVVVVRKQLAAQRQIREDS